MTLGKKTQFLCQKQRYTGQVKCLQSNGNQYINLGNLFYTDDSFRVDIDFTITQFKPYFGLFGYRTDDRTHSLFVAFNSQPYYLYLNVNGKDMAYSSKTQLSERHVVSLIYTTDKRVTVALDGVQYSFRYKDYNLIDSDLESYLFRTNAINPKKTNPYSDSGLPFAIHKMKISGSGLKQMNLVPVVIEDVCSMYDTISKTHYYNVGTGTFGYTTLDGRTVDPK